MDPLDHLAGPAADLLGRVDDLLLHAGAPDDHRIWSLLRRLGALPGEAVEALTTLGPAPLADAGTAVDGLVQEYDDVSAAVATGSGWEGAGAEAFAAQRATLVAHLNGDQESLTARLAATAAYLAAVADWMAWCRAALARVLAEVLGSAEAVAVVAGGRPGSATTSGTVADGLLGSATMSGAVAGGQAASATMSGAVAAAEIGARVLATVAEAYDRGEILVRRWRPRLAEVTARPAIEARIRLDGTTRITF
jgi:hypothetical protein